MRELPGIMVAPNGASRMKTDHPALPITIDEVVGTAAKCLEAGADGLHAHVRDKDGRHVLDSGLYRELLVEMHRSVPGMAVQITTEAVGRYGPVEQMALVREVMPEMVSCAYRELAGDGDRQAGDFYRWAAEREIAVQHIVYEAQEVGGLFSLLDSSGLADQPVQLLFVLGRYTAGQQSDPSMIEPFLAEMKNHGAAKAIAGPAGVDWAVCAFGRNETACLHHAHRAGGRFGWDLKTIC